ncbi:ATP-binding protein [Corynebacterium suedekumii]|nr:ATP-binding protein [Corynebacterium suedekumii]
MGFEERLRLIVDEAYATFTHGKVDGLIRRAGLRYPAADLRRIDLVEQRGLNRNLLATLATCGFIERHQNVVFQGFTGSGKSYLGCALAKQACQHRYRAHYIRMPDLEEAWATARDKPQGATKFLKKYAAFTVLVIDEWLLDHPDEAIRSMLLELLERRYDSASTVFCTQYAKQRLASKARIRGARRCDHGPDRAQHHLGRHRHPQHAGARHDEPVGNTQRRPVAPIPTVTGPRRQYRWPPTA